MNSSSILPETIETTKSPKCGSEFVHCYLGMFVDRYVCLHCNYEWR